MDDPRVGIVLDDRYKVIARLAAGGMGVVYRAERLRLGRPVAIKFLHGGMGANQNARRRFEIEARAMGQLQHPHCASVIDYGIDGDAPYVVMDFIEGDTLRDLLEAHQRLPATRAIDIVRQVLAGLEYAHALGITHRDIKPPNIMVGQTAGIGDLVRILDFGLARLREGSSGLTSGFIIGTPTYMAPEQTQSLPVDARTDVYAAGILLFELLTGVPPYQADEPAVVMMMHREAPVPRLSMVASEGFSEALEEVVARALAKDPAARFSSAAAFGAALEAVPEAGAASRSAPTPQPTGAAGRSAPAPEPAAAAQQDSAAETHRLGTMPTAMVLIAPVAAAPGEGATALTRELSAPAAPSPAAPPISRPEHWTPAARAAPSPTAPRRRRWLTASIIIAVLGAATAVALVLTRGNDAGATTEGADPPPAYAASNTAASLAGNTPGAGQPVASAHDEPGKPSITAETPVVLDSPALPAPSPLPELEPLRRLVDSGDGRRAQKQLLALSKKHDHAEIHYLLGRVYFDRMWFSDGIASYKTAIARDPAYRQHPELIKSALIGFLSPQNSRRVGYFLRTSVGEPAIPYLQEMASDHTNPRVRERAASALRAFPDR